YRYLRKYTTVNIYNYYKYISYFEKWLSKQIYVLNCGLGFRFEDGCIKESWTALQTTNKYRYIQTLAILMNEIQQKSLMSVFVVGGIISQSFSMSALIMMPSSSENILLMGVISVAFIESMLILIIFLTLMGQV